ncbi:MAG: potassium channel protein [Flavobacteriales bacterium]|nr:potassium channel protein [Flavobacteriales bacterium]
MVFSHFKIFSRIFFAIGILFAVIIGGSFGFVWLEGYTWSEAFYMTIITVTTVGFEEVKPLSENGRIFTSVLILTSIGTFTYALSAITTYFVAGEFKTRTKEARVNKQINELSNHVIVCGYGRVGEMAVSQLVDHGVDIVVLESNQSKISFLTESPHFLLVRGDATADENLIKAGVQRAKAIITTLPDDADNLYTVLTARELNRNLTIISRASKSVSVKKLRIAGADNVIMPDKVGGAHMASLVITPDVAVFFYHIRIQGRGTEINLEEVSFSDLPKDFQFQTLGELDVRNRIGVNVIGFKTGEGEYIINPGANTRIVPNSKLFVLGNKEQIRALNRIFGLPSSAS